MSLFKRGSSSSRIVACAVLCVGGSTLSACTGRSRSSKSVPRESSQLSQVGPTSIDAQASSSTTQDAPTQIAASAPYQYVYPNDIVAQIVVLDARLGTKGTDEAGDYFEFDADPAKTRLTLITKLTSDNGSPSLDTAPLVVIDNSTQMIYRDDPNPDNVDGKHWHYCNADSDKGPWNCISQDYFSGTKYVRAMIELPDQSPSDYSLGWLDQDKCEQARAVSFVDESGTTQSGCLIPLEIAGQ